MRADFRMYAETSDKIARRVLLEARNSIIEAMGAGEWNRLTTKEKAYVCRKAARCLYDMERFLEFMSDETDERRL